MEYGKKHLNEDVESGRSDPETSRMNLNVTVDLNNEPSTSYGNHAMVTSSPNVNVDRPLTPIADDSFENIMQVTAQHEALVAYYYMDEDNKVKVTEIFDVSECESPAFQTETEKETNLQLEFDDEWSGEPEFVQQEYLSEKWQSISALSSYSIESLLNKSNGNLFLDPESEWTGSWKVEEPDDLLEENERPESERSDNAYSNYTVPPMSYDF